MKCDFCLKTLSSSEKSSISFWLAKGVEYIACEKCDEVLSEKLDELIEKLVLEELK